MAIDVYSGRDCKAAVAEQATWNTALPDNSAAIEIDCAMEDIQPDPNKVESPSVHGSRSKLQGDVHLDTYQLLPGVSMALDAQPSLLDHLLYAFFQQVTEGASTPFSKTFAFPATQPDFTAVSPTGYIATIFDVDPVAAHSLKIKNAISQHLKFGIKANGRLSVLCDWIGMGNAATSTPSGTLTRAAAAYYHASNRARCNINFGAGLVGLYFQEIDIDLKQTIQGIGQSGSGDYYTYGITERSGTFSIKAIKTADLLTARTNANTDVPITFNLGWGNATPGTVSGDLDITFQGKIFSPKKTKEDTLAMTLSGEILPPDAATSLATIIMANAIDRAW